MVFLSPWTGANLPTPLGDIDYFHIPYPSSPLDLLPNTSRTDTARDATDPFDQLPQEVSDQILSQLSIPALDAARYVSRTWYRRVMTNSWVLRQVLEPDKEHLQFREDDRQHAEALRCLARELDVRSKLTSFGNSDKAWRVRYRRCDIAFSVPGCREHFKENEEGGISGAQSDARGFTFAGVSSSGSLVAFIYAGAPSGEGVHGGGHSVLIYHIDSAGKPELVAPIACPQDNGVPIDVDVFEGDYAGSWLAGITFSGQKAKRLFCSPQQGHPRGGRIVAFNERSTSPSAVPSSLRDVQRYCSDCCDYHKVSFSKNLNAGAVMATLDTVDVHAQDDWVCIGKCDCSGAWLILENLPILVGRTQRPYYLARHEQTGDLFVVRLENRASDEDGTQDDTESGTDEGFQYLGEVVPLVLLVRPHHHTSYANISVSPQVMFDTSHLQQVLRIAVLWHEADYPATERVSLYTYDVVTMRGMIRGEGGSGNETAANSPLSECYPRSGGWIRGTDGQWSSRLAPPQAEPFDYLSTEYLLINPNARQTVKLKGRASGRRVCGFERGMGGLHTSLLPPSDVDAPSSLGSIKLLGDGRKKCMIWGPDACSNIDGVRFMVLEFGKNWHTNEYWELSISENELCNNGVSKGGCVGRRVDRSCACSYHDYGYRVTLPDSKAFSLPLMVENMTINRSPLWPFDSAAALLASRHGLSPAAGQITAYRRYGDVLAARKKDLEDHRRLERERKREEEALAEVLRAVEQNRIQGHQAIPPNASRTSSWFRWKGLFGD